MSDLFAIKEIDCLASYLYYDVILPSQKGNNIICVQNGWLKIQG